MPRCCSRGSIRRLALTNSRSAARASLSTSRGPTSHPQWPVPSCNESRRPEANSSLGDPLPVWMSSPTLRVGMTSSIWLKRKKIPLTKRLEQATIRVSPRKRRRFPRSLHKWSRGAATLGPQSGKSLTDRAQDDALHKFVDAEPPGGALVCKDSPKASGRGTLQVHVPIRRRRGKLEQ